MAFKKFLFSVTFSIIVVIVFTDCADNNIPHQDESAILLNLEKEAIAREFKNDTSFLSSIMDSTFIELSPKGLKNKHKVLRTMSENNLRNRQQNIVMDSFKLNDPIVHMSKQRKTPVADAQPPKKSAFYFSVIDFLYYWL